ncbi:MAG: ATP-binding cassette domain-containing protein [Gemmatimonadales bacterium]|nr:ATP-binding cassette domain-containing protein [Gemmatimonadales bacterium]
MTAPPVLALRGIRKRFGSVQALRGADFTLAPRELHALLGENGAGKTTLMQVAYGLVRPESGEIAINGVVRTIASPRAARRLGVGMVHQHFTAVPALTVAENVALAAGWKVRQGLLRERVREFAEGAGLPLDPSARAGDLSVALLQRLEIVKALASDARILLLDEPTAVLAPGEAADLLRVVRGFTVRGGAAVLITHKLDEALAAADRVTVLRRGAVVFEGAVAGQSAKSLASAMIGDEEGGEARRPRTANRGRDGTVAEVELHDVAIRLEDLEVPRETGYGLAVRGASLSIRRGEIVGIAAVEGNGQRELLRAVAGRLQPLRGRREIAEPVAFVPEDRTTEGLIPGFTLTQNVVLGSRADDPWIRRGRIDWRLARSRTAILLEEYGVVAPGPDTFASALSGGNQQKVVLARELARRPRVVVAENPTRGLDIRAAEAVQARLRGAASDGAAVLIYSSDLDEVLALAHRVLVAARGKLLEVPADATRAQIGQLMVTGGR